MASTTFTFSRDTFGKLVMTAEDGQVFEGVAPVRAFPIQSWSRHYLILAFHDIRLFAVHGASFPSGTSRPLSKITSAQFGLHDISQRRRC